MENLAIFNAKGGVGKTTTAVNLAACFAAMGHRVLVFDLDAQGNATTVLGKSTLPVLGTYDVISGKASIQEAAQSTFMDGLRLVGATRNLAAIDLDFILGDRKKDVIRRIVSPLKDEIDIIVMDCPPAFGSMTINALVSADAVLIPSQPNPFAHDGLLRTWTILSRIRSELNHNLSTLGIVPTFVQDSDRDSPSSDLEQISNDSIISAMRAEFGDLVHPRGIPLDTELFTAASAKGIPACVLSPDSPSSLSYLDLAASLIHTGRARKPSDAAAHTQERKDGTDCFLLKRIERGAPLDPRLRIRALPQLKKWHEIADKKGMLAENINVPPVSESAIRDASISIADEVRGSGETGGRRVTLALAFIGAVLLASVIAFLIGWGAGSGLF